MTVQYEQPDINGMPAPALLAYNPSAGALSFGATNTASLAIPASEFTFDAAAFAVSNTAADGTIIRFQQPGLYRVDFTVDAAGLDGNGDAFLNILLGKTDANAITSGNGYPASSYVTPVGSGLVGLAQVTAVGFLTASAIVRLSVADVEPVGGSPNTAAVLQLVATPAAAPDGGTTRIKINRIGA